MGKLRDLLNANKMAEQKPPILPPTPPPVVQEIAKAVEEARQEIVEKILQPAPLPTPELLSGFAALRAQRAAAQKLNGSAGPEAPLVEAKKPEPPPKEIAPITQQKAAVVVVAEPVKDLSDPLLAEIKANIQFLSDHIEEKELIAQVARRIMQQMRANPHFRAQLTDLDKENIVRGFRRAYNVAAMHKVQKAEKKERKKADVDEVDRIMEDLGLGDVEI